MNFRGYQKNNDPEINLIPLIDVLLVILIFLMVSTTYQRIRELQITLPTANAAKPVDRPGEIQVGLDPNGNYYIPGEGKFQYHGVQDMAHRLLSAAKNNAKAVIIINADAKATHQNVIHIMEAARAAGMSNITFATNEASQ